MEALVLRLERYISLSRKISFPLNSSNFPFSEAPSRCARHGLRLAPARDPSHVGGLLQTGFDRYHYYCRNEAHCLVFLKGHVKDRKERNVED